MDRGAWKAAAHGVTESDTAERLSTGALLGTLLPLSPPFKAAWRTEGRA